MFLHTVKETRFSINERSRTTNVIIKYDVYSLSIRHRMHSPCLCTVTVVEIGMWSK